MSRKKAVLLLVMLVNIIGLFALYARQDESKKRFIKHLVRQVPYLPGRYFA